MSFISVHQFSNVFKFLIERTLCDIISMYAKDIEINQCIRCAHVQRQYVNAQEYCDYFVGVSPVSHSAQASPQHTRIVTSRSEPRISSAGQFLVQPVTDRVIDFLTNKEDLKAKLAYQGHLYRYACPQY